MNFLSKEWILGYVFAGLFLLMTLFVPGFFDAYNLINMLFQLPELGILSLGMMVVLLTAGIDLSITFLAALAGVIVATLLTNGYSVPVSILAGVATALAGGLLNGFFIAVVGVSPILVTLGTMTLFEGIVLLLTKGNSISGFPESYSLIGNGLLGVVPIPILIFAAIAVILSILLNKTAWGRSVYMFGNNPTATLFSGINTTRVVLWVYLFAALMAAVAAIIMTSRYNSAKVDIGSSYLLQSIAVAVLGGTSISGGYGKVIGVVLAVGIFQIISNGLNLLGVSSMVIDMLMGTILIGVLLINYVSAKRKQSQTA
ncbi:ABC transporter permease [Brevibacillus thermoruber]|jgi:simple sugar transport system permease protein|uniref:ABC transporter permease n=1 Tax=Brevibacillus thermoruber TaxID=33942 RepID=A0A9X3Z4M0_9BACL|nr:MULTISPECIES: ABC transporter permease [Brevibacillus]MDA5109953.1 ABC transporter permease [Brevibacillus thermoruber]TRY26322.1 ABC transporter permease [Brevibacillus sp. LEMMJ03]